jgi:UDP-2-acetamido-3-amino-2,3-dideoxy-glucuronate N-acetyltransferase
LSVSEEIKIMVRNIAVIGCGYWGKNLVRNFSELGVLESISDPDQAQADKLSNEFGVPTRSFEEIIDNKDINGVALAVPATLHASMSIAAMQASKHVYVEKPLALNAQEALQMISAAQANNVHLMVGHLLQYHPVFVKLREIINKGDLGRLRFIGSNRLSLGKIRSEEDVIWSFAPHDISMILSLTGKEPLTVKATASSILQEHIADIATIEMEFSSTLKCQVNVSWLNPYKEQKLVVTGDNGMMVFDDTKPWAEKLAFFDHKFDLETRPPNVEKAEIQFLPVKEDEPLKRECQYFVDLIKGKEEPLTDGEEGLRVLNVLTASTLSIREERTVRMQTNG